MLQLWHSEGGFTMYNRASSNGEILMLEPLTPADVQAALRAHKLDIEVQFLDESSATAPQAAAALNTELGSIVKSLVFMVDGKPVVVLTAGDQRVHDKKLAEHFGVSRKKIKIAKPDQCVEYVGYTPGGVPPLGHRHDDLTILIDQSLSRYETVYAAAGAHNTIFPIKFDTLAQITGGTQADVVREQDSDGE
jgi:prolyl-tRNA editing enzyme YbaK/EbsC (Cys-tRNA(Pro) deacylase)